MIKFRKNDNHGRDWVSNAKLLKGKPPFAWIWNPVFSFGFMFTWDTDEKHFNMLVRHYHSKKLKRTFRLNKTGGKFLWIDGESYVAITKHRSKTDQIECIAHEAHHLVHDIVGDGQGVKDEETMAYCVGWAVSRMVHMIELHEHEKKCLHQERKKRKVRA